MLYFKEEEWLQIATLLEKGYPVTQILQLLQKDALLHKWTETNETMPTCMIECAHKKFKTHLQFFIMLSSFSDAIFSALHMISFEKEIKQTLIKKTMYPSFVFLFSTLTIYMFSNFVIPQLLQQFNSEQHFVFLDVLIWIKWCSTSFLFLLLTIIFISLLIASNKVLKRLFYIHMLPTFPLLKNYLSYYLSGYLKTLHERGLSSKQSFQFLLESKRSYLHMCVQYINEKLAEGEDLQDILQECPYLGVKFKMFYVIGAHNGQMETALSAYMEQQQNKWFSLIQKISIGTQIISYALVGILVICVYQIMLLPLSMI